MGRLPLYFCAHVTSCRSGLSVTRHRAHRTAQVLKKVTPAPKWNSKRYGQHDTITISRCVGIEGHKSKLLCYDMLACSEADLKR
jgi:hypothetical protein